MTNDFQYNDSQQLLFYGLGDICLNHDLKRLGIDARLIDRGMDQCYHCGWDLVFQSEEDLNLYKLAGLVPESSAILFKVKGAA